MKPSSLSPRPHEPGTFSSAESVPYGVPGNDPRPTRVLFIGDSITDAFRKPEEINPAFQLGNGFAFLVASRMAVDLPGHHIFFNRGRSGDGVGDFADRWETDAVALAPDLVSVLVGVNETIRHFLGEAVLDVEEFKSFYRDLLLRLRLANPVLRMVLIEPFLLRAGEVTGQWQAHLAPRQAAVQELADEMGAVFVPAQSLFDTALSRAPADFWAYDGIHLTHAGCGLLADAWLRIAHEHIPRETYPRRKNQVVSRPHAVASLQAVSA
jgi:lysophospholipase L1-like esterase